MRELHIKARRIFRICITLVALYLVFATAYAWCNMGSAEAQNILFEMLHSAAISAFLSLGGALLIDAELRRAEN